MIEVFLNEARFGSLYISNIISFSSSPNFNICLSFPFSSSKVFRHWGNLILLDSYSVPFWSLSQLIKTPISFWYL